MYSELIVTSQGLLILDLFENGSGPEVNGIKQASVNSAMLWLFETKINEPKNPEKP